MAKHKLSAEQFQQLRELAALWGKTVAQRVADNDPDACLELDFEQMEQLAAVAAQGLTEGTLAALVEQQAHTLNKEIPCPDCNTLCTIKQKKRPLTIPKGQLQLQEPCSVPQELGAVESWDNLKWRRYPDAEAEEVFCGVQSQDSVGCVAR